MRSMLWPAERKKGHPRKSECELEKWVEQQCEKRGDFYSVKFWRVILDESHIVKIRRFPPTRAFMDVEAVNT